MTHSKQLATEISILQKKYRSTMHIWEKCSLPGYDIYMYQNSKLNDITTFGVHELIEISVPIF